MISRNGHQLEQFKNLEIGTVFSYWHTAETCLWTMEKTSPSSAKVLKENPPFPKKNVGEIVEFISPDDFVSLNRHLPGFLQIHIKLKS